MSKQPSPKKTPVETPELFVPSPEDSFRSIDSELVIGFVGPTGGDIKRVSNLMEEILRNNLRYQINSIKITEKILKDKTLKSFVQKYDPSDYDAKINALMDAGNDLRRKSERSDFLALLAIKCINEKRKKNSYQNKDDKKDKLIESLPKFRSVHFIHQFKHPAEVRTFRKVYGPGFYLIGVHTSYSSRLERFKLKGVPKEKAEVTLLRDLEEEDEAAGQHTRDTFALADAFISTERSVESFDKDVNRILEIIFGNPFETPTKDEYCMFLAYAASLRSADLSRQVGAVLVSEKGDITATGCNEVAKAGGGQYWAGEVPLCRDYERGKDSNDIQRRKIIEELKALLGKLDCADKIDMEMVDTLFRSSSIWDITEYGRSIHAEMEAMLSCARAGISTRNSTLFTTTFPCHNCAKHIVDAGIKRVVFVEPYPKSRAPDLLSDSINIVGESPIEKESESLCTEPDTENKVQFVPFIGISARRFVDLFSMHLTTGEPRLRKKDGVTVPYSLGPKVNLKVPLMPNSYLQRERSISYWFEGSLDKLKIGSVI